MGVDLRLGDCLEVLKMIPDNSVDSVVTDPPYGLSFMGKTWDYDVPSVEIWKEVLRVLKPGGHLLSFFGTRTYHRGVVRIEDAGFEIRDQIQWIYGSGFPKSLDVSKAIDKEAGAEREVIGRRSDRAAKPVRDNRGGNYNSAHGKGPLDISAITAPATKDAKLWQGWGTALKPANEPIVVARKPLEKGLTVAENVTKWGTGAINVDGCRISSKSMPKPTVNQNIKGNAYKSDNSEKDRDTLYIPNEQGRWPANVLLDEVAAEMLDEQSGILKSGELKGYNAKESKNIAMSGKNYARNFTKSTKSEGGASRFFYVAKASKSERNAGLDGITNGHPTIKPIKLMSYLVTLITPPSGTVLDPFMGSGSTGVAAKSLNFHFIGIEKDEAYFEIASKRIA